MEVTTIPFKDTGYFSKLICDYLDEKKELNPFYNRFPSLQNFKYQIQEKSKNFDSAHRDILVKSLTAQYENTNISESTSMNIDALGNPNTFTVVTGHQLNLFTGPLYFLYKIVSTINLTRELQEEYPDNQFVPVYWMATEDHDFDEINHFNFDGKKMQWHQNKKGAVGRLPLGGLEEVYKVLQESYGKSERAQELLKLYDEAYLKHQNLAAATRYLVNHLFKDYGLVILDGDDKMLKELLIPHIKKDVFENMSFQAVSKTINEYDALSADYKIQVNPREINYFYLKDGQRERIIEKDGIFYVNETEISFSKQDLTIEIERYPERFSPNVIARPLYQEVILPNLCYIGGGGELAYWLELKSSFNKAGVTLPMLLLRNSALLISQKNHNKAHKLDLSLADLFLGQNSLVNKKIRKISNIDIDFSPQKKHLENQFEALYEMAEQTDKSFLGAVKAQEIKQKKGLNNLEKRLLKAQKRKLKDHVARVIALQNQLFPNYSLQERQHNFSTYYLALGDRLIPELLDALKPLQSEFLVLRY